MIYAPEDGLLYSPPSSSYDRRRGVVHRGESCTGRHRWRSGQGGAAAGGEGAAWEGEELPGRWRNGEGKGLPWEEAQGGGQGAAAQGRRGEGWGG